MNDTLYQISQTGDGEWLVAEAVQKRLQRFRDARIRALIDGTSCLPLEEGAKVVLHVLPERALTKEPPLELLPTAAKEHGLPPLYASGRSGRYNLDGYL